MFDLPLQHSGLEIEKIVQSVLPDYFFNFLTTVQKRAEVEQNEYDHLPLDKKKQNQWRVMPSSKVAIFALIRQPILLLFNFPSQSELALV